MYFKYLFFAFSFLILTSCSSVKKISEETTLSNNYQFKKENVKQLVITGKINSTQKNAASASFKIEIFDKDTLAMSLFGPMGMLLMRLYSTEKEFLLYNAFAGEAMQGSPESNAFSEFLPIPVKFHDLISLMRNETPFNENDYSEYNLNQDTKEKIYKYDSNQDFVEFVVFDNSNKLLKQVQRKSREDKESVNVIFKDYIKIEEFYFPKKIIFDIKKENMQISFDCENYIMNKPFDKSLKFGLPSGVKVNKI
ncbi:MAG: DUF4292 domain-containing protein [Candidatus Kapabacteria bacterium]|nr:DUF4292 domain-containing protein [Candidatus Kapabacteria bacterium]